MGIKFISLTAVFLVLFLNSKIFANEVGDRVAVSAPKAKPIHVQVSEDGNSIYRSWPCDGFVNPRMIKIISHELVTLSKASNLTPPDPSLCLWRISDIKTLGVKLFQVQMFVDRSSMESCIIKDKCIEVRSMYLKGEEGLRDYILTNSTKQIVTRACVANNGSLINLEGCR